MNRLACLILLLALPWAHGSEPVLFSGELIFPLDPKHNHAPGIVETPTGDLLVSWYRGSGERSADDVRVLGARLRKGESKWSDPFELVDTPGFPDCNTTMYLDERGKLWLFWPVILNNQWEGCLTNYRTSIDYAADGPPKWNWQGALYLKPVDFVNEMKKGWKDYTETYGLQFLQKVGDKQYESKINDKLLSRLGWQPRNKPIRIKSGRILLPLYSDTYSAGLIAYSDDQGKTWLASKPIAAFGGIQATLFEKKDGTIVAYMRENGVLGKIRVSESADGGITWGKVGTVDLPNPGSGCDGVRLANGHWVLLSNNTTRGRNKLLVSLSEDEGRTWSFARYLENQPSGSFHYPAVIQAKDGSIHAVYSYFVSGGKSMKHVRFNESWIRAKE